MRERSQTLPILDRAACVERDTSYPCKPEQLLDVTCQRTGRVSVGDLPLVVDVEHARLAFVFSLS